MFRISGSFLLVGLPLVFFEELLAFSAYPKGPLLVQDFLAAYGIAFHVEPHLQYTYLDGAAFLSPKGSPVLAMTLRHDRLDNFWFTLMHELGHILLHLAKSGHAGKAFFDDTNTQVKSCESSLEKEANDFSKYWLLPLYRGKEKELADSSRWTRDRILQEAAAMHRSPAILTGRIRWESGDYSLYPELLGNKAVKSLFELN
jgi:HTH-type transcriptional regulator/antitoxin HigA